MKIWAIFSIWLLFSAVAGFVEAFYYSSVYRHKINRIKYDHAIFTVIRGCIAAVLIYFGIGLELSSLLVGISFVLSFPFMHDGAYYQQRQILDGVYSRGWFDDTTTSDAIFNFDYITRIGMFIISLFIFLI